MKNVIMISDLYSIILVLLQTLHNHNTYITLLTAWETNSLKKLSESPKPKFKWVPLKPKFIWSWSEIAKTIKLLKERNS